MMSDRLLEDHDAAMVETPRRVYRIEVSDVETRILLVDAPSEREAVEALRSGNRKRGIVIGGEGKRRRRREVRSLGQIPQPLDDDQAAA